MPIFIRFISNYMRLYGHLHIIAYICLLISPFSGGFFAAFSGDLYGIICIYI